MTLTMFGLANCDTVKKARAWLDAAGIAYDFHDYKKVGAAPDRLRGWVEQVGWEKLVNRAGTTFRKLPESERAIADAGAAIALMAAHPSLIKRPVVEREGGLLVGFKPDEWQAALV